MDEELSARFYEDTLKYLRGKGFERYEVSNFAKGENNRSEHNMVYWQGGDYLGLGVGAHGRLNIDGKNYAMEDGRIREELTSVERAMELIIMGLRIKDGIDAKRFYNVSGVKLFDYLNMKKVHEFGEKGLIIADNDCLKLTDDGFLLMDKIIEEIIP